MSKKLQVISVKWRSILAKKLPNWSDQTPKKVLLVSGLVALGVYLAFGGGWQKVFIRGQHGYYRLRSLQQAHTSSRIDEVELHSAILGVTRSVKVYLPPDYDKTQKHYPVLFLFHGDPGSNDDWLMNASLQSVMDEQISQKLVQEMIVVMPDLNGPHYQNSHLIDSVPKQQKMETWFMNEVVPYVDKNYRTLPRREARAIGGDSTGAYAALNVTLHHLDKFSVLLLESGFYTLQEKELDQLIDNDPELAAYNNGIQQFAQLPTDHLPFYGYMAIGDDDYDFIKQDTAALLALIKKDPLVTFDYQVNDGSHGWDIWREDLPNALQKISAHLAGS